MSGLLIAFIFGVVLMIFLSAQRGQMGAATSMPG